MLLVDGCSLCAVCCVCCVRAVRQRVSVYALCSVICDLARCALCVLSLCALSLTAASAVQRAVRSLQMRPKSGAEATSCSFGVKVAHTPSRLDSPRSAHELRRFLCCVAILRSLR